MTEARSSIFFSVDIDGDGDNDLVANTGKMLMNDGDGTFPDVVDCEVQGIELSADFDGDGDHDLVVRRDRRSGRA